MLVVAGAVFGFVGFAVVAGIVSREGVFVVFGTSTFCGSVFGCVVVSGFWVVVACCGFGCGTGVPRIAGPAGASTFGAPPLPPHSISVSSSGGFVGEAHWVNTITSSTATWSVTVVAIAARRFRSCAIFSGIFRLNSAMPKIGYRLRRIGARRSAANVSASVPAGISCITPLLAVSPLQ
ncbi:MAG: hypothetical protein UZ07_CHB004001445 [Chlorobi bacterium OLB7]|nr:MAG: hypothetical protein UZ07_CHB004001445 [Chlorobi bacterium OLB7]